MSDTITIELTREQAATLGLLVVAGMEYMVGEPTEGGAVICMPHTNPMQFIAAFMSRIPIANMPGISDQAVLLVLHNNSKFLIKPIVDWFDSSPVEPGTQFNLEGEAE